MSKEKQCKCCKEYWYTSNLTNGLCPNCYDYVADLEAKLAESEEKCNKQWLEIQAETHQIQMLEQDIKRIKKEYKNLEQQLTEKEKEYGEMIEKVLADRDRLILDMKNGYTQDKISFAVEQLEKVKEYIDNHKCKTINDDRYVVYRKSLVVQIDNQIKQLKEGK